MMWLLSFLACFGDSVTSEGTFVGRVVDPHGSPIEGLLVSSMEAQARSEADGAVDVPLTPENRLVHFTVAGTWYRQTVLPEHVGTVVEIAMPPTRAATLWCPDSECDLTLTWQVADGLEAQVSPACEAGASRSLTQVPEGPPEVACSIGRGPDKVDVPVMVQDQGPEIRVALRRHQVRVRISGDATPSDCRIQIGDRVAPLLAPGVWAAEASRPVTVGARCDGIPSLPVRIDPSTTSDVVLRWTASTPTLATAEVAPWAKELVIAAEAHDAGWSWRVAPDDRGRWVLPPLEVGTYRLMVRAADAELPLLTPPPQGSAPGVATFGPAQGRTRVGRLVVTEVLAPGPVQVSVVD